MKLSSISCIVITLVALTGSTTALPAPQYRTGRYSLAGKGRPRTGGGNLGSASLKFAGSMFSGRRRLGGRDLEMDDLVARQFGGGHHHRHHHHHDVVAADAISGGADPGRAIPVREFEED